MLQVAESVTVAVQARKRWNDTGVHLIAGQEYEFKATGEWIDLIYHSDAEGYASPIWYMRISERWRRVPKENWFALIGALDFDRTSFFKIGTSCIRVMERSGALTCFANDVSIMYWNNKGSIQLMVTRTR
jgi:hypothetical protein